MTDKKNEDWEFKIEIEEKVAPKKSKIGQAKIQEKVEVNLETDNRVSKFQTRTALYEELQREQKLLEKDVIVTAPVFKRGIALAIDLLFFAFLFKLSEFFIFLTKFLCSLPMERYKFVWNFSDATMFKAFWGFNFLLCLFFFHLIPVYSYNTTLGKKILGLRVRGSAQYTLNFSQVVLREILLRPLSILLVIGFIVPFFNADRRSIHDYIAKTQVILD